MSTSTKELKKKETREKEQHLKFLLLFNDDYHSFDYVIECLIAICGHTAEQAEQSALIAHYKGKCKIHEGTYEELKPMKNSLIDAGLSAAISD